MQPTASTSYELDAIAAVALGALRALQTAGKTDVLVKWASTAPLTA